MLRPLDLQTLYMNLDKVGKEQALSKEAQALAQANQVLKMQKEHDQGQHAVTKVNATTEGEGSLAVQADGQQAGGEAPRHKSRKPGSEEPEEEQEDKAWKDTRLGNHVDLSG